MVIPDSKIVDRILWMDCLKLVAIYCVFLGHAVLFMGLPSDEAYADPVYCFIYSFHMPLFMMLSGFFQQLLSKRMV